VKALVVGTMSASVAAAVEILRQRDVEVETLEHPTLPHPPARIAALCDVLVGATGEIDGSLLEEIRQDPDAAALPIAVWGDDAEGREGLERGADIWFGEHEPAATIALRLLALVRRARLGGGRKVDPLTGLGGAERFRELLRHEFERAARYRRELSVLVFEPDGHETLRAAHGPEAAEQVLRDLSGVLAALVRDVDLLARLSPRRLCLLLPETEVAGAQVAAERLVDAVRERALPLPGEAGAGAVLTASCGLAGFPARGMEKGDDLLGRALEALLQAQRRGPAAVVAFGCSGVIWSRQAPDPSLL
jgi:diguanylate cyclase (GGDEF)-like protein